MNLYMAAMIMGMSFAPAIFLAIGIYLYRNKKNAFLKSFSFSKKLSYKYTKFDLNGEKHEQ